MKFVIKHKVPGSDNYVWFGPEYLSYVPVERATIFSSVTQLLNEVSAYGRRNDEIFRAPYEIIGCLEQVVLVPVGPVLS
jgi:hypothetical protein